MIYLPLSKFQASNQVALAAGRSIVAEGQVLIGKAGVQGAIPATTTDAVTATSTFLGFAVGNQSAAAVPALFATKVEKIVVPASGTVQLSMPVLAFGGYTLDAAGAKTAVPALSVPAPGTKAVTGLTAGTTLVATYSYALTAAQSQAMQGNVSPGGFAGGVYGQVGCAKSGLIYTDLFDATLDWSAAVGSQLSLAADGTITELASGVLVINAVAMVVPTPEVPFLGIEFSAA